MNEQSYRAVQASRPGVLELVERRVVNPGPGQVRIRVEACGMCNSDRWTIEGHLFEISYPRVPGHKVIGKVDAVGEGVTHWKLGQRVGVGWTGVHHDGGYAEMMIAYECGLISIPEELASAEAAPLLCAGIAIHKALKKAAEQTMETIAILGVGGLGHLAIQFAKKMGFRTIAIGRGSDKAEACQLLGAHDYIAYEAGNPAATLRALGGADILLSAVIGTDAISPVTAGLSTDGKVIVIGDGPDLVEVSPVDLVGKEISIEQSLSGMPTETETALAFSVLRDIRASIDVFPLAAAQQAYEKMVENETRFRPVLTM